MTFPLSLPSLSLFQRGKRFNHSDPIPQHAGPLQATTPPDAPPSRTSSANAWTAPLRRRPPRTRSIITCLGCKSTSRARGSRNKRTIGKAGLEGKVREALGMSLQRGAEFCASHDSIVDNTFKLGIPTLEHSTSKQFIKEGRALFKAEDQEILPERGNARLTAHDEYLTNNKQRGRGGGNKKQGIRRDFFHRRWDGRYQKSKNVQHTQIWT